MGIEAKEAGAGTNAEMDTGAEVPEPAAREGERVLVSTDRLQTPP